MKKYLLFVSFMCLALTGCVEKMEEEKESAYSGKTDQLYIAIKEVYGDSYAPDFEYNEAKAESELDIDMDNVKDFFIEQSKEKEDTVIIIEAETGKIEDVIEDLENYKEKLVLDNSDNLRINAATIYDKDNYAFFVILGEDTAGNMDGTDKNSRLKYYKEQNQKAVDAIDGFFGEV
ncbi:DUF4358 domain-containing protein [Anaerotignum faecicola]|nr:DUF4358 domain-containing protein [Anaerotignum faecicola]